MTERLLNLQADLARNQIYTAKVLLSYSSGFTKMPPVQGALEKVREDWGGKDYNYVRDIGLAAVGSQRSTLSEHRSLVSSLRPGHLSEADARRLSTPLRI